jgi:hypothetical protein
MITPISRVFDYTGFKLISNLSEGVLWTNLYAILFALLANDKATANYAIGQAA